MTRIKLYKHKFKKSKFTMRLFKVVELLVKTLVYRKRTALSPSYRPSAMDWLLNMIGLR